MQTIAFTWSHYSVLPLCFYASARLQAHLQISMRRELPLTGISVLNYAEQRKITGSHGINSTDLTFSAVKDSLKMLGV